MTTLAPARTVRLARRIALCVLAATGVAVGSARSLAAQADVIRGRVTAAADNAPILGVVVTATSISGNVSRTARTNSDGRFTIIFPGRRWLPVVT